MEARPFGLSPTDGFLRVQLFETFNEIVGQISTILPEAFLPFSSGGKEVLRLHSTHLRTPNVRADRGGKGLGGAGARVLAGSQRD
jgi:hypothetical protein